MFDLSRLNICFIAGTLGQGGAERQLVYMLEALKRSGADPRLLCLTRGEFWEESMRKLGVPITWVGQEGSRLARLGRIVSTIRRNPTDILQSQHFYTNLYAAAAARIVGVSEICAIRNNGISEVRRNGAVLGRLSLRAPRMIVANSRAAIRNAIALGVPANRLHLLPNVVDTDVFKPGHRRADGKIRLIAAGRLTEQKRMDRFLTLLSRLRAQSPVPVSGILVGEGSQRTMLEEQAARLELLPDTVDFRGAVADMVPVYAQGDVFILTSGWEGTPNVVLEAMSSGLPVVATRVGGVPDIIRHGETGLLVDADDDEALANSVLALISSPEERVAMARRARAFVEANHSPHGLPRLLAGIYEAALS
jgi:glycosyltransferase involved in cell wall biosynthesis